MIKILVVINASKPQTSSIEYACHLAALTKSKLTGLFMKSLYSREEDEQVSENDYFEPVAGKTIDAPVKRNTDNAVSLFMKICSVYKITHSTLFGLGEPIQEVIHESRYADLLIFDPGLDFYSTEEGSTSHFTKEILALSECPVLLAPEKTRDVDQVVFCFDRSPSSVFAIKQFTYLLPQYANKAIELLEVKGGSQDEGKEDDHRMIQWLQEHYSRVAYTMLSDDAKEALFTHLFMKEKKLIVMGSYGRSSLSTFFRRSTADTLLQTINLPFFITHFKR